MSECPITPEEYADLLVEMYLDAPLGSEEILEDIRRLGCAMAELYKDLKVPVRSVLQVMVGGGALASKRISMLFEDSVRLIPSVPKKKGTLLTLVPPKKSSDS